MRRGAGRCVGCGALASAELPVEAFPAVAHLALAKPYLAGRNPSGLVKRLRLTRRR